MLLIPLVLTGILTQAVGPQIRKRRRAMRAATDDVTGFIGETFGAVQAIKLFRAEQPVLERFANLNRIRHRAALADTFLTEVLRGINRNMSTVSIAVVLIFAAGAIQRGEMSLGELTVFLTYLPRLDRLHGLCRRHHRPASKDRGRLREDAGAGGRRAIRGSAGSNPGPLAGRPSRNR